MAGTCINMWAVGWQRVLGLWRVSGGGERGATTGLHAACRHVGTSVVCSQVSCNGWHLHRHVRRGVAEWVGIVETVREGDKMCVYMSWPLLVVLRCLIILDNETHIIQWTLVRNRVSPSPGMCAAEP
jgi:hypothetical protein